MRNIYNILLFLMAVAIWTFLVLARFAKYDVNYVYGGLALLISLFGSCLILGIWFFNKHKIKQSALSTTLFLSTSSPVSIYLLAWIYSEFVGQYFQH
jgi:hypothetical protein